MNQDLDRQVQTLRRALLDGDAPAAATARDWLMGEAAAALLAQDAEALRALRSVLPDLAPLADRYGDGRPGDRWRAVWELLHACSETIRPLEQVRLARPGQLSGLLLRHIGDHEGITPGELSERVGKKPNQVSNALKLLAEQGLVQRVPQGRTVRYYLSGMGRESLAAERPVRAAVPAVAEPRHALPHLRAERLEGRDLDRLPAFRPAV